VSLVVLYKHKIFSVTYAGVPARLEFWGLAIFSKLLSILPSEISLGLRVRVNTT